MQDDGVAPMLPRGTTAQRFCPMTQSVRRHWLLDRRPIGSGMNDAIELPRRQRQQRITARE
jgi:hypothetical protein